MWRDYFPRGRIFGVDISPEATQQTGERIQIFTGSQADSDVLARVIAASGPLDLVVDDGSHRVEDQLPSLTYLWPHVKPGGFYIVEDTHTSYLESYGMGWRKTGSTIAELTGYVDDLHRAWHDQQVTFRDLESVHFYPGTCVLRKASGRETSELRRRIDAAAARQAGAWTR